MKFSFIIPFYNSGDLLVRCIESILSQRLLSYEIILIDDGSTDDSASKINKFINDKNVLYIKQKNSGVSVARNRGLREATGDYVFFVDSDDFYFQNTLKEFEKLLLENYYDLVFFGYEISNDNNRHNDFAVIQNANNVPKDNIKNVLLESLLSTKNNLEGYIWRCCFNRLFLMKSKLLFSEGISISEDYLFLFNSLTLSKNIYVYPKKIYCYYLNNSSVTKKYIPKLKTDMEYINNEIERKLIEYPLIGRYFYRLKANTFVRIIQNYSLNNTYVRSCQYGAEIRREYIEFLKQSLRDYKFFPLKTYVGIFLSRFRLIRVYIMIFKLKKNLSGKANYKSSK